MRKYQEVPSAEKREGEAAPETKVILHFLRHEAKESVQGKPDQEVQLTEEGCRAAIERGLEEPANSEVAWAAGSDRIRAEHTALLRVMAGEGKLTPEMDYGEAEAVINKEMRYGKKVVSMPELNFGGADEFQAELYRRYKAGEMLEWFLNESDNKVRELQDKDSLSYSRVAANYASLIAREMQAGNNFNKLVERQPDKYAKFNNTLERYFGTHQTVSESFYMKVLEKTQGRKVAEEFIDMLRDDEGKVFGFDFQEGIEVEIANGPEGQRVTMKGARDLPDIELTPELLSDIIGDAEKLDEELKKAA